MVNINNRVASFLVFLSAVFAYFPFVGFVQGMDLQPNFFLVSLCCLALLIACCKVGVLFFLAMLVSIGAILFHFAFVEEFPEFKYLSTYLMAIFAIFYFYIFFPKYHRSFLSEKLILFVFCVYAGVGLVQILYPEFLAFVVTRSVDAALSYSETGRGVRSLTGEPSSLGKIFSLLNALYVLASVTAGGVVKSRKILLISFLFLLANIVIARSAYAAAIHFFLISILWFLISKRTFFICLACAFVLSLVATAALIGFLSEIRGVRMVDLILILINDPQLILQQGAMRRVLNIPISINNLFFYGYSGAGNSSEVFNGSLWTPLGYVYYYGHSRNIGGFVEFLLKFGIFSVPIVLLYFGLLVKACRMEYFFSGAKVRIGIYFFMCGLLLSFQDSSPALPLALLLVVGSARVRDIKPSSIQGDSAMLSEVPRSAVCGQ